MFAAGAGSSLRPLAVVHTRGTPATRGRLGAWSPCCTAAVDWLAAGAPWNQVCCHGRDLIGWGARPRSSTPRDALVKHGGRRATGRQCVRCSAAARVGVRTCSSVTSLHCMHACMHAMHAHSLHSSRCSLLRWSGCPEPLQPSQWRQLNPALWPRRSSSRWRRQERLHWLQHSQCAAVHTPRRSMLNATTGTAHCGAPGGEMRQLVAVSGFTGACFA